MLAVRNMIGLIAALSVLVPVSIASAANGETLEARTDRVKVRSAPSWEAPVTMVLERGRKLKELRRSGPWLKAIIYGTTGKDGWVRATEVAPLRSNVRKDASVPESAKKKPRPVPEATSPRFTLAITGTPQPFRARCIIIDDQGAKRRISIEGNRPKSYGLDVSAVDCRVDRIDQHAGTLRVELYAKESSLPLGANFTNEAFGCVHVRSDGPWGRAYGRRCSRVIHF